MRKRKTNDNFAVGYCRFSSDNQREESIDAQKRAIKKYAEENGIIISKWYVDEAKSATTANRPGFREMIEDSKTRTFNLVLVHKMDRFSRNVYDTVHYKRKLQINGVTIFSVTERFKNDVEGKLMENSMMGMAEYFSGNLSRETLKGMRENAYNCKCNGGLPPYGYKRIPRMNNGVVVTNKKGLLLHDTAIDEKNAEAVKLIFNMTLQGKERREIVDTLNELGFKKYNNKPFDNTTYIDAILRNERYTGTYIFYKFKKQETLDGSYAKTLSNDDEVIRIEDGFPKIIEKEVFDKVQQIIESRVHRSPANTNERYLLSGKVICGECGKPYAGYCKKKEDVIYSYYKCTNNGKYIRGQIKEDYCKNTSIRRDEIEDIVIKKIKDLLSDENLADKIYNEFNEFVKNNKLDNSIISTFENEIKTVNKQINNIVDAISNGLFNDALSERLRTLEAYKQDLQEKIKKEIGMVHEFKFDKEILKKALNKAKEILEDKDLIQEKGQALINSFLNKVVVYKDYVEVYINVLPASISGNFSLSVNKDTLKALYENKSYQLNNEKDVIKCEEDIKKSPVECPQEICNGSPQSSILWGAILPPQPTKKLRFCLFLSRPEKLRACTYFFVFAARRKCWQAAFCRVSLRSGNSKCKIL